MEERKKIITVEYFPDAVNGNLQELETAFSQFKKKGFHLNLLSDQYIPDGLKQLADKYVLINSGKNQVLLKEDNIESTLDAAQVIETTPASTEEGTEIKCDFILSPHVEIFGNNEDDYSVKFTDQDTGELVDEALVKPGFWVKADRKWFTRWLVEVYHNDQKVFEHKFNAEGKKVFISLQTKSLKNTIAWFPFIEAFKNRHKCGMIVSTHWNELFSANYPDIEFVLPDADVTDLYAAYEIGLFLDEKRRNKNDPREIPLQQIASDYLGLEHTELKPEIVVADKERKIPENYVCISEDLKDEFKFFDTAKWQEVVEHLIKNGYKVIAVGKEKTSLKHIIDKTGELPLPELTNYLKFADFFIGQSNGWAWLSWALNTPVIMLMGLKSQSFEFQQDSIKIKPETEKLKTGKTKKEIKASEVKSAVDTFVKAKIVVEKEKPVVFEPFFELNGNKFFYNRININNDAEKAVEIPVFFDFLARLTDRSNLMEYGNSLSTYENSLSDYFGIREREIIDNHGVLFNKNSRYSTIVAASTVNKLPPKSKEYDLPLRIISRLYNLLARNGIALISVPFGKAAQEGSIIQFGKEALLKLHEGFAIPRDSMKVVFMKKAAMENKTENPWQVWREASLEEASQVEYNVPWKGANALAFIYLIKR